MRKFFLLLVAFLAGCGQQAASEEAQVQIAVRNGLKDPGSAQFGALTLLGDRACQTVNAKNSYGGYTGAQQAFVKKMDGKWLSIAIHDVSHSQCIEVIKQI